MIVKNNLLLLVLLVPLATLVADPQHQHAEMPEQLGSVHFQTTCDSNVQQTFERAVALLHSFWYEEAQKAFQKVVQDDPKCAIAYWGIAMTQWHQVAGWPDPDDIKVALKALDTAETLKTSDRERAYISAISLFFRGSDKEEALARATAYSSAMSRIYQQYPEIPMPERSTHCLSLHVSLRMTQTSQIERKLDRCWRSSL